MLAAQRRSSGQISTSIVVQVIGMSQPAGPGRPGIGHDGAMSDGLFTNARRGRGEAP